MVKTPRFDCRWPGIQSLVGELRLKKKKALADQQASALDGLSVFFNDVFCLF